MGMINSAVTACLYDWTSGYSASIGGVDSGIPPWLFGFLEKKIFPFVKESFSRQIEALPADSKTKSGLQTWLSQTTLSQLGASRIPEVLDLGVELWSTFISNVVHEIHHNILNHSAWERFSNHGDNPSSYNYLDALEEGVVSSIKPASGIQQESAMWQEFSLAIADFLEPMFKNTFKDSSSYHVGEALYQNWSLVYQHLDQIKVEEMGVKLPEEKLTFLRKVFDTFYKDFLDNGEYQKIHGWYNFRNLMGSAIKKVWSQPISAGSDQHWDFLTGDDEILLINLMKDLDSRADELWDLWKKYEQEFLNIALQNTQDCIDLEIQKSLQRAQEVWED